MDENGEPLVCLIKKGIYGLHQSGYAWAQCFKDFMIHDKEYAMGFTQMTGEANMYRKAFMLDGKQEEIFIGQYVDDCLVVASSDKARKWFTDRLSARFPVNESSSGQVSMENPGLLLSMELLYDQRDGILTFNQSRAIDSLATKFDCKQPHIGGRVPLHPDLKLPKLEAAEVDVKQYMSIIGSCLHICQVSRPDCSYAVGALCRHSQHPGEVHMKAARDLVGYMYKTIHWSIRYTRSEVGNCPEVWSQGFRPAVERKIEERLIASTPDPRANDPAVYVDADHAGCSVSRRSTTGMFIAMNGGGIAWLSRLQKLAAQSSAESEIYAVTESVKEAIHIRLLCEECKIRQPGIPMTVWEDNNACIQMGHALRGSNAAKHFELRLRFLYEHIAASLCMRVHTCVCVSVCVRVCVSK